MTTLMIHTLPTTQARTLDLGRLPIGLTETDTARIATALGAARSESTRRVYAYVWGQRQRWCDAHGLSPMPADPADVVRLPDRTCRRRPCDRHLRHVMHRGPSRPPPDRSPRPGRLRSRPPGTPRTGPHPRHRTPPPRQTHHP